MVANSAWPSGTGPVDRSLRGFRALLGSTEITDHPTAGATSAPRPSRTFNVSASRGDGDVGNWRITEIATASSQRASLFRFLKDGAGAPPLAGWAGGPIPRVRAALGPRAGVTKL